MDDVPGWDAEPSTTDAAQMADDLFGAQGNDPREAALQRLAKAQPDSGAERDIFDPTIMAAQDDIREQMFAQAANRGASPEAGENPGPVTAPKQRRGKVGLKRIASTPSLVTRLVRRVAPFAPPVLVAAGLVLVALAVPYRAALTRAFPDLAALYELVGLEVNVRGIEFSGFRAERSMVGGVAILRIEGSLLNPSDRNVPLGPIRLSLKAGDGQELFAWRVDPPVADLAPGSAQPIVTELTAPPSNIAMVSARFLKAGERLPGQAL